jgi:hypothetical protein
MKAKAGAASADHQQPHVKASVTGFLRLPFRPRQRYIRLN